MMEKIIGEIPPDLVSPFSCFCYFLAVLCGCELVMMIQMKKKREMVVVVVVVKMEM